MYNLSSHSASSIVSVVKEGGSPVFLTECTKYVLFYRSLLIHLIFYGVLPQFFESRRVFMVGSIGAWYSAAERV